jgi:hypothetical protein
MTTAEKKQLVAQQLIEPQLLPQNHSELLILILPLGGGPKPEHGQILNPLSLAGCSNRTRLDSVSTQPSRAR